MTKWRKNAKKYGQNHKCESGVIKAAAAEVIGNASSLSSMPPYLITILLAQYQAKNYSISIDIHSILGTIFESSAHAVIPDHHTIGTISCIHFPSHPIPFPIPSGYCNMGPSSPHPLVFLVLICPKYPTPPPCWLVLALARWDI